MLRKPADKQPFDAVSHRSLRLRDAIRERTPRWDLEQTEPRLARAGSTIFPLSPRDLYRD